MRCRPVFAIAAVIGFVNGVGIVALGISPIVMTLATNGMLQGAALLYSRRHACRVLLAAAAMVHDRKDSPASRRSCSSSRPSSSVP